MAHVRAARPASRSRPASSHGKIKKRSSLIKEQLRAAVDDSWRSFRQALEPLTAADMEVPGACGDWSVKEVLTHIAAWESRVTAALLDGIPIPDPDDLDAFNEAERRRQADMSVAETSIHLDATHRALREAIKSSPPEVFASGCPMRRQLDAGTVLHYDEHADGIRTWYALYRRARARSGE